MKTWRRKWQPTPVFLTRESHGQRSLVGYSPWDRRVGEDGATSTFTFSFRISLGDWKLKQQGDTSTYLLEWLKKTDTTKCW